MKTLPESVEKIVRYNAGRDPERLALKYKAIADNAFSFLRGTCPLYFEQIPKHAILSDAPVAWICGDLHLENFGTYKGDNGLVYFDMNDFDEAILAPCSWEILRTLTSILIAAPSMSLKRDAAIEMAHQCLATYGATLASGKSRWIDRDAADGLIGQLFEQLRTRKRQDFIASRTTAESNHTKIRTDKGKALPASDKDKSRVLAWISEYAAHKQNPAFFKVIDIARRIAGTGSLGLERFAILIEGKGGLDGHYLLDLKESIPSALAPCTPVKQPKWHSESERVATIAARMQAVPASFLEAVELDGKPFLVKGLQPTQDRVDLEGAAAHPKQLNHLMCQFGGLAASAQLRASGRQGSANADALVAFGSDTKKLGALVDLAVHMADQVEKDWKAFSEQYKKDADGLLALSTK
ncbi:MAG TPA: DUF2252 family protein [Burkholderiaceae bacterium]